jgi:hypothetical protein
MKFLMKTPFFLLSFLLLISCKKEQISREEPVVYHDYFQITDAVSGKDMFLGNSAYTATQVRIRKIAFSESDWLEIPHTVTDTAVIFGPLSLHEKNLLRLTASQTDTIRLEQRWGQRASQEGPVKVLLGRSIFYNGSLAAEQDFEKDPELRFRLPFTNGGTLTDSTFIIKFKR